MRDGAPQLPPVLASIAEVAGVATALDVARRYCGTRVTVPVRAEGRNWLTQMVGPTEAEALIDALGGGRRIDIPLGPQGHWAGSRQRLEHRLDELLAEGKSSTAIARLLGVTERTIRNRRRARRDRTTNQPDLFS